MDKKTHELQTVSAESTVPGGSKQLHHMALTAQELEAQELELTKALDISYEELEALVVHRETINSPEGLSQMVIKEVWNRLGEQFGLELTNETLIQEHIRKNPQDNPLANAYSKEIGDKVLQDSKYKQYGRDAKVAHQNGTQEDAYTGNVLGENDKPNIEHVISREEHYGDLRRVQSGETVAEAANDPSNIVVTNENLNKSKGKKSVETYTNSEAMAQRRKQLEENYNKKVNEINTNPNLSEAEKKAQLAEAKRKKDNILAADEDKMKAIDKEARRSKTLRQGKKIAVNTAKKAGKDAIKAVLASVVADFLKKMLKTLIAFFKESGKSFTKLMTDLKRAFIEFTQDVRAQVRKYLNIAKDTIVGTILSEAFAPVLTLFKKAASFVKQGFKFVREVFGYYKKAENRVKSFVEQMADIGKLLVGILSVTGGLLLSEVIEKSLLAIPIFAITIPLLGTLANFIATLVSSIVFGVIGAISIYYINKFVEKKIKTKLTKEVLTKQDEVLTLQEQKRYVLESKVENRKEMMYQTISDRHRALRDMMVESLGTTEKAHKTLTESHKENRKVLDDIDRMLDNLE